MDYQQLLDVSVKIGELLLRCEAEIYRVEESVSRLLEAYGCPDRSVFAIPSFLIVTIKDEQNRPITQSVRILERNINLSQIHQVNHLCRQLCMNKPPLPEVAKKLQDLECPRCSPLVMQILMAGLVGLSFCLFFGGSWQDGICGALCGIMIGASSYFFSVFSVNLYFSIGMSSALSALTALLAVTLGLGQNVDSITIGALMNLVPGVAITNSMRDVIGGDLIAGLLRLVQALMTALFIALGVGLTIALFH